MPSAKYSTSGLITLRMGYFGHEISVFGLQELEELVQRPKQHTRHTRYTTMYVLLALL